VRKPRTKRGKHRIESNLNTLSHELEGSLAELFPGEGLSDGRQRCRGLLLLRFGVAPHRRRLQTWLRGFVDSGTRV
jgi:hypothetical protein